MNSDQFVMWLSELVTNSDSPNFTSYQSSLIKSKLREVGGTKPQIDGGMPEYFDIAQRYPRPTEGFNQIRPERSNTEGVEKKNTLDFIKRIQEAMIDPNNLQMSAPDWNERKVREMPVKIFDKQTDIVGNLDLIVLEESQEYKNNRATMRVVH